ncbi:hypothetical protein HJG60_009655 [Phyllostomus discolor]|uniref:Uncharacterized protein n=1 Tax=Phyllostomus discolor TaxID=89673 RepID=A0A834ESU8_9CHIR|nr:hypothetical protein HJG60_009655 [Phyllostomus discolor]
MSLASPILRGGASLGALEYEYLESKGPVSIQEAILPRGPAQPVRAPPAAPPSGAPIPENSQDPAWAGPGLPGWGGADAHPAPPGILPSRRTPDHRLGGSPPSLNMQFPPRPGGPLSPGGGGLALPGDEARGFPSSLYPRHPQRDSGVNTGKRKCLTRGQESRHSHGPGSDVGFTN